MMSSAWPWSRPAGPPWEDQLRARLFEQRTILLRGELTDAVATQAAAELMTLDATGDTRVTVHLDLSGGALEAAFAVIDVIDLLGVPVHILCTGRAEGAAVGILAVGAHRTCTPHARLRLADPVGTMSGPASEIGRWAEQHRAQVTRFHQRLAAASRLEIDQIAADCARGRYLTPDEARGAGLIDEVAAPRATITALGEQRPFGFGSAG
jgi:ATP-dependent Clp protease protease subunit